MQQFISALLIIVIIYKIDVNEIKWVSFNVFESCDTFGLHSNQVQPA